MGCLIAKDELGGGTEKNGTTRIKYCSHCFLNGEFTLG
ncbi:zinc ribbon domain-containing protein [Neobacillus drentensis]|nr:zinc ribbon domain-containing protein [Neobacillus drentensis]ULT57789.1 zinc ribbon domain-containing protein [Neobacillus drentensis]